MIKKQPQTMAELLAQTSYQPHGLKKGEEIEGTITSISPVGIRLDINAKTEGVVLEKDKRILSDLISTLKVGDTVRATVLNPESDEGYSVLSLRRQRKNKAWQLLLDAHQQDKTVDVIVTDVTRSGFLVDFSSIRGFIPSSHLVGSEDDVFGKTLKVKVLEIQPEENRLIFSQKAVAINTVDLKKELAKIKINDTYTGIITNVTKFGLFVSIKENVEGLVHISEVSWDRVMDLEKQFHVGQKVQVLVTGVNLQNSKINLSLKQLLPDPWFEISRQFSIDQQVEGEVSSISRVGVFVVLADGLEGLIHQSKIPLGHELHEGEKVTCIIESVDAQKRRISLVPVLKGKPVGYR